MKEAMVPMVLLIAMAVAFCAARAPAQTTQPAPVDDTMGMRGAGSTTMPGGGAPMGGMGQGGAIAHGPMGAAGAGAQHTCCPPRTMSTIMQGGWWWVPMLLGTLLVLSVVAVLISLSIFLLRRSQPRPATQI